MKPSAPKPKNIILFLGNITNEHIAAVHQLEKYLGQAFRIAVLTKTQKRFDKKLEEQIDFVFRTNLQRIDLVEKQLLPVHDEIAAIVSKFENMMPLYGRLTSLFPYLKNPTPRSLNISTDKFEMRKAFRKYAPQTIPKFIVVTDADPATLDHIEHTIKFPCIIKPASLSKSQLVINCYDREELAVALSTAVKKIQAFYKANRVEHPPKILVEQLLEGNLYSVDVYVNSLGHLYYTPFIEIKTGKDIGHDDFFMYLQMTPASLDNGDIESARSVVAQGIYALGLRSCTAHVEFYQTKRGYKIVEIAARTGGFRDDILYDAYGIRHHMNDILIRLGKKPHLKNSKKQYTAFMKFWPKEKGTLHSIKGFKKNSERSFVLRSKQQRKPGDYVGFSKFGYTYICSFNLAAPTRAELLSNIRKIEKSLSFVVRKSNKRS